MHQAIAAELLAMVRVDQEIRAEARKDGGLWDTSVDQRHTARLKAIVAEIGWPTISKVGAKAAHSAWLLVQHAAADPAFMKQCFALMKDANDGDLDPGDIAYLEDRLLIMEGKPQRYGTQFYTIDGATQPFPIEDPDHIDERRRRAGLETYAESVARITAKHRS